MKIDAHSLQTIAFQSNLLHNPQTLDTHTNPFQAVGANYSMAAQSLFGLRGQSQAQRTQTFGQLGLQAAELALSSVFGAPAKFAVDALARTGEGKRVVKFVGHALDQTYQAQKALFKGDLGGVIGAFEGGSSHKQRCSKFFAAVSDRIHELQTRGGTLTQQDIQGFKQAIAYGDIHPLGDDLDLTKLDLMDGTNPFGPEQGDAALLARTPLR
jgi:hypothetical protein